MNVHLADTTSIEEHIHKSHQPPSNQIKEENKRRETEIITIDSRESPKPVSIPSKRTTCDELHVVKESSAEKTPVPTQDEDRGKKAAERYFHEKELMHVLQFVEGKRLEYAKRAKNIPKKIKKSAKLTR